MPFGFDSGRGTGVMDAYWLVLVAAMLASGLMGGQVSGEHCSAQDCSTFMERLEKQEARISAMEQAFRRTITAFTTVSKALQDDAVIQSVVQSHLPKSLSDEAESTLPLSTATPHESTSSNGRNGEFAKAVDVSHHQPIEVIQSVDHLAANSADGWRLEIERLNRELNGIFEVMGQWEKELRVQNETLARLDQRLHETRMQSVMENSLFTEGNHDDGLNQLRGGLQCSLAHLVDFEYPDYFSLGRYLAGESPTQGTSSIEVTLDGAGSTTLEWQLPAPKCHQFLTSVWIRVFEPVQSSRSSALYFQVPRSCLQKDALGSFSLQIPPTESPAETPCNFSFKLVECREYAVEIVPNYGGLRGKVLVARFKSMPQMYGSTLKDLGFSAESGSLHVNWTVQSNDCDRQLDSVRVTMRDAADPQSVAHINFTVGSQCFTKTSVNPVSHSNANPFAVSLSPLHSFDECRYQWPRIDQCIKYRLELEPTFWAGSRSNRRLQSGPTASKIVFLSESDPKCCNRLTAPSGELNLSVISDACFWWITAPAEHNIWLTVTQLEVAAETNLTVYDGPDASSPVLLSRSTGLTSSDGEVSVRSASPEMFVRMNCDAAPQEFSAVYTTVMNEGVPFVAGCGGYIRGTGVIRAPHYGERSPSEPDLECVWFVESLGQQHTILLDNMDRKAYGRAASRSYSMTVYNGWTAKDDSSINDFDLAMPDIYSLRGRARIHFQSKARRQDEYMWRVSSVWTP